MKNEILRTITITHGPYGKPLMKPLFLQVPQYMSASQEKTLQFIVDTFVPRTSNLAAFTYQNSSTMTLARHYLFLKTSSKQTFYMVIYSLEKFCKWAGLQPDEIIRKCLGKNGLPKPKGQSEIKIKIDDYLCYLKLIRDNESTTLAHYVGHLRTFLALNGVNLQLPYKFRSIDEHPSHALTRDEIQKVLDVSTLRERAIVAVLATSGLRIGTLSKLKYRHVKHDLERNITPLCISVETNITKGMYHSYCTFLNQEAADYLRAYLQQRRIGTAKIPPELITDDSPLIRSANRAYGSLTIKPIKNSAIEVLIHELFFKAGLITRCKKNKRYDLRAYSFRKFFKTELSARGVNDDCVEFMMGHKVGTYSDPTMKGAEYLRGVYLTADLRIRPREKLTKIEALKEIASSWGLDPNKILSRQFQANSEKNGTANDEGDFSI